MSEDLQKIEEMRTIILQTKVDLDYNENGLTEGNLQLQVEVNKLREEYDIADESEVIFTDEDFKEYVQ